MWPRGIAFKHPAAKLLQHYSTQGCPVDIGEDWSVEHIITALKRGPHISAKKKQAALHLRAETKQKVQEGYAKIIKWSDIKDNIPPNIKISPVAMIPHKSRSYRTIIDLSFQLRIRGKIMPSVNSATKVLAPQKAMAQIGTALKRIIFKLAENYNLDKPFIFSKVDLKDGFWRMVVNQKDAWNFCYVLPSTKNNQQTIDNTEIVVPHALQMGWAESPPFFCAATETARDIIQDLATTSTNLLDHPLQEYLMPKENLQPESNTNTTREEDQVTQMEVYVDDFVAMTNNRTTQHLLHWSKAILHGIHSIFPPPEVSGHSGGDPVSEKKLMKKEGLWHHEKEILGWIFNGCDYTLRLPSTKTQKIKTLLKQTAKKKTILLNDFQKLAGYLAHASIGIPKGQGLLSAIYKGLQRTSEFVTITKEIKQCLMDWKFMIQLIESRPTSVLELVPEQPWFIGYTDASGTGAGGVWTDGTKQLQQPIVWRCKWPTDITNNIISDKNPKGSITINELELAGELIAWLILEQISPISLKYAHIGIRCDNAASVSWANKLNSTSSIIAGQLLKALATRQHVHASSPMLTVGIPGKDNQMADVASRSFTHPKFTNTSKTFSIIFNEMFPLQNNSWKEYHLHPKLFSRVISCLRGEQSTMAWWLKIPRQEKNTGLTGRPTQICSRKIPSSKHAQIQNKSSSSQLLLQGSGQASTVKDSRSQFKPLLKRSQSSQRPVNWLENHPQSFKQRKRTKSQWHGWWKDSEGKTHPLHHS